MARAAGCSTKLKPERHAPLFNAVEDGFIDHTDGARAEHDRTVGLCESVTRPSSAAI